MKQEETENTEYIDDGPHRNGAELADQLDVTPETIRKDLTELAAAGEIVRIHGGAALASEWKCSVYGPERSKSGEWISAERRS